jgi:archaemetzincin
MKKNLLLLILAIITITFSACRNENSVPLKKLIPTGIPTVQKFKLVIVQPIGKTDSKFVSNCLEELKKVIPRVALNETLPMPKNAYYSPGKRYRADTLINWLKGKVGKDEIIIGITQQDISTTKGKDVDFGVMGLGFLPGKACIASSVRLRDKKHFYKVALHELGHNLSLPHCPVKNCYMGDANGRDRTAEQISFCSKCKQVLQKEGWKL